MVFIFSGTEIVYKLYDPTIQKIEVLKLEKRLDNELFYLRDALPEYSTFPLDMEAELLPEDSEVPINDIKVSSVIKPVILMFIVCSSFKFLSKQGKRRFVNMF